MAVAEELGAPPEITGVGVLDGDVLAVEPTLGDGLVVAEWVGVGVRVGVGVELGV